tara:strand:+ start:552 stop:827 length:276 start_codon:yes stop_codon:yes gene_type:complete
VKEFLKGPDKGNVVLFLVMLVIMAVSMTMMPAVANEKFSNFTKPSAVALEVEYIETVDVPFSRCTCDGAIYCLTDEEYTIVMAQLAGRGQK